MSGKTFRRVICVIFTLMLIMASFGITACFAAEPEVLKAASGDCGATTSDKITWSYDDSKRTLTIECASEDANMENYNSTDNLPPWHEYQNRIELIYVDSGVRMIGDYAFAGCKKLTFISLPKSLQRIGNYAFSTSSLNRIFIPRNVTYVGEGAFKDCEVLKGICFFGNGANNPLTIGKYAFSGCIKFEFFSAPNRIGSIGDGAFTGVPAFDLYVPEGDVYYGSDEGSSAIKRAIMDCGGQDVKSTVTGRKGYIEQYSDHYSVLFTVTYSPERIVELSNQGSMLDLEDNTCYPWYGDNIETLVVKAALGIGDFAFQDMKSLKTISTSGSLTTIGESAFQGCTGLDKIGISMNPYSGTKTIRKSAFEGCSNADTIYLSVGGGNLATMGEGVCRNCTSARSLTLNNITLEGKECFAGCTSLENVNLNKSTTWNIPEGTFEGCTGLKTLELSCGNIGQYAFRGCSGLQTAKLTKVGTIDKAAFEGCSSLSALTVTEADKINYYAFQNCAALEEIALGTVSGSVETEAFSGCTKLRKFDSGSAKNLASGILNNCPSLTEITIGKGTTQINLPLSNNMETVRKLSVTDGNTKYASAGDHFITSSDGKTLVLGISGEGIPATVTTIKGKAFKDNKSLKTLTLPYSITDIEFTAFMNCTSLETLSFPKEITGKILTSSAFTNCKNIKKVEYFGSEKDRDENFKTSHFLRADGIEWIYYCGKLTDDGGIEWEYDGKGELTFIYNHGECTMPDYTKPEDAPWYRQSGNITKITADFITNAGNYAFYGMNKLTNDGLKLDSVTTIGKHSFEGCTSLTAVPNADHVTSVGEYAFDGCSAIENADLAIATGIGDHAFEGCSAVTSAAIPAATGIGAYAFNDCSSLDTADLSAALTIGDYAFSGCPLKTPGTLTYDKATGSIGSHAFEGCEGLSAVTVTSVKTIGDYAFSGCENLATITLPADAEKIGKGILGSCPRLTTIIVSGTGKYNGNSPDNTILLEETGASSFTVLAVCPGINSLDLSLFDITEIGNEALSGCGNLESIILPATVEKIGDGAFSGCEKLTSINIPVNVSSIGDSIFSGCTNLTTITVDENNSTYKSENNTIIAKDSKTLIAGCNGTTEIPAGIKAIGEGAFKNCTAVKFTSIPDGVTEIGDYAFSGCTGLTEMDIPGTVERIGIAAFADCTSLAAAPIPSGTKTIDKEAFSNCIVLADEIDLSSASTIGDSAFEGCVKITKATLPAAKKPADGDPDTFGKAVFKGCTGLEVIDLPEGIQYIPDETFSGCTGIKGNGTEGELIFPDGLLSIGKSAFKGVSLIKLVYIPESLELIDTDAFALTAPEEAEYPGSAEAWYKITVNSGNDPLLMVLKTGYVPTIYPYDISISPKNAELTVSETLTLSARFSPSNTTESFKTVIWSSSDPEVAAVDSNGVVTAKKIGEAKITVKTDSDEFEELSASSWVTVVPLKYTITYKPGYDGPYSDRQETKSEGSVITLDPYGFPREGYTLSGWVDQDKKAYAKDESGIIVKGNMTFTAQWDANPEEKEEEPEEKKETPTESKKEESAKQQHIEKSFALTDSNGNEINVSMFVDMAKTISYNGCKHVPEGGKANKSTLADVKFSLSGNILDHAVIKKITVKNNKNVSTDGAKVILSLKATGKDKKIKKSISEINKKLKAEPLSFEIIPLDLSSARGSLKVKTNSKKTKVSKLIYSVPGGKDITLPKKSYSVDSIGDGSVTISGKDNCSGVVTLPY